MGRHMTFKKITPYSEEYSKMAYGLLKSRCPPIYPCATCGAPVVTGYCCGNCGSRDPRKEPKEE